MRHKPKFAYSGLTIVLSYPSRFDTTQLLSGFAGYWYNERCLQPFCNRWQCDVRTVDTIADGLLDGTKCILALGEPAMRLLCNTNGVLNNLRGSPFLYNDVVVIPSYQPQDCMDMKASYEQKNNPNLAGVADDDDFGGDDDDPSGGKEHGKTRRTNFKFWLWRDTQKAIAVIKNNGKLPTFRAIQTWLYPSFDEIHNLLSTLKDDRLYLDIETDCDQNLTCFGIGVRNNVYVVPFLRYNYTRAYDKLPRLLADLAISLQKNEVIVHNSHFDLLVLAVKYRIPLPRRVYDTMLAQHRCFPEAEHSLGHSISYWLFEQFHKDEGVFMPHNAEQEHKLWTYNGKDVSRMMLIREAQDAYAKTIPGLAESISQSNRSVYPYLLNTLLGIRYNKEKVDALIDENDGIMTNMLRILRILCGHDLLPTSPPQCVKYFHYEMGYPAVARTDKGNPTLRGQALYKLKIKHPENIAIDFVLRYRELGKQTGTLMCKPWNIMEKYQVCQ